MSRVRAFVRVAALLLHDGVGATCRARPKSYELASLVSDPGSQRQVVHPDTPARSRRSLVTVFVALQDVAPEMGPTVFLPRTHTREAHATLSDVGRKDALLASAPSARAMLSAGSAAVFDAQLLHAGQVGARPHAQGDGAFGRRIHPNRFFPARPFSVRCQMRAAGRR